VHGHAWPAILGRRTAAPRAIQVQHEGARPYALDPQGMLGPGHYVANVVLGLERLPTCADPLALTAGGKVLASLR
jgi:hypothetical protein